MHKPLVNNRRLNDKWSAQTNELMIKKLQGVKPQINSKCPESFFFFKTQFKKASTRVNKLEQFEVVKNNENLLRKLLDVNIDHSSKLNKNKAPVFTFKKNFLTGNKKYDIIKIAQENQSMLKRLNERSSFYDVNKWEKDYQMNQYYKRNHCVFPSIDFKRSNSGLNTIKAPSSPKQGLSAEKKRYNHSYSSFEPFDETDLNDKANYIQINEDSQKDSPKVLYNTQVYLGNLGSCRVEFAVQVQNFTIKVASVYEKDRVYGIIFDSRKSVENIQKHYKKYEDMIHELEYDEKNDVVKFNNLIKKDLMCRCIKLPTRADPSKVDNVAGEKRAAKESQPQEGVLPVIGDKKQEEEVTKEKEEVKELEVKAEAEVKEEVKEEIAMEANPQDNKEQLVEENKQSGVNQANETPIEDNPSIDQSNNENRKGKSQEVIEEVVQSETKMKDNTNSKQEGSIEVPAENSQTPQEADPIKVNNKDDKGIPEEIKINN